MTFKLKAETVDLCQISPDTRNMRNDMTWALNMSKKRIKYHQISLTPLKFLQASRQHFLACMRVCCPKDNIDSIESHCSSDTVELLLLCC